MVRSLSPDTREAIVQATLELAEGQGFDLVTTRAIAERAGVSEATVFRYFPRKELIYSTIMETRGTRYFAELESVVDLVDSPRDKLLAFCRGHVRFAAGNRNLIALIQREAASSHARRHSCTQGVQRFLALLQGLIRSGIERGVFRADLDVEVAALALHGVVPTLLFEEHLIRESPLPDAEFSARAERFYQFHLRGMSVEEVAP